MNYIKYEQTTITDRSYYKGEEILASREAGIAVFVAKTSTYNVAAKEEGARASFIRMHGSVW